MNDTSADPPASGISRRGGRGRPSGGITFEGTPASPYLRLHNPYPPIAQLSNDQVEAIHQTSLELLEETGMRVLH